MPEVAFRNQSWADYLASSRFPALAGWQKNTGEVWPVMNHVVYQIFSQFDHHGTPCRPERIDGEEAWSTPAIEDYPTYFTEDGMVIGAPEAAAYERDGVELRKTSELDGGAGTAPRTGSTSSDEGTR